MMDELVLLGMMMIAVYRVASSTMGRTNADVPSGSIIGPTTSVCSTWPGVVVRDRAVLDLECLLAFAVRHVVQGMVGADVEHLGGLSMDLSFSMLRLVRNWVHPRRAWSSCKFWVRVMRALDCGGDSIEVESWLMKKVLLLYAIGTDLSP